MEYADVHNLHESRGDFGSSMEKLNELEVAGIYIQRLKDGKHGLRVISDILQARAQVEAQCAKLHHQWTTNVDNMMSTLCEPPGISEGLRSIQQDSRTLVDIHKEAEQTFLEAATEILNYREAVYHHSSDTRNPIKLPRGMPLRQSPEIDKYEKLFNDLSQCYAKAADKVQKYEKMFAIYESPSNFPHHSTISRPGLAAKPTHPFIQKRNQVRRRRDYYRDVLQSQAAHTKTTMNQHFSNLNMMEEGRVRLLQGIISKCLHNIISQQSRRNLVKLEDQLCNLREVKTTVPGCPGWDMRQIQTLQPDPLTTTSVFDSLTRTPSVPTPLTNFSSRPPTQAAHLSASSPAAAATTGEPGKSRGAVGAMEDIIVEDEENEEGEEEDDEESSSGEEESSDEDRSEEEFNDQRKRRNQNHAKKDGQRKNFDEQAMAEDVMRRPSEEQVRQQILAGIIPEKENLESDLVIESVENSPTRIEDEVTSSTGKVTSSADASSDKGVTSPRPVKPNELSQPPKRTATPRRKMKMEEKLEITDLDDAWENETSDKSDAVKETAMVEKFEAVTESSEDDIIPEMVEEEPEQTPVEELTLGNGDESDPEEPAAYDLNESVDSTSRIIRVTPAKPKVKVRKSKVKVDAYRQLEEDSSEQQSDDVTGPMMEDIPGLRNTSKEFQALFGYPSAFKIGKDNEAFDMDRSDGDDRQRLKSKSAKLSRDRPGSFGGVIPAMFTGSERRGSLSSEPDTMPSAQRRSGRHKRPGSKERPLSTVTLPDPSAENANCNNAGPGLCRKVVAIRDYVPKSDQEIPLKKGKSVMLLRVPEDFQQSTMAYGYRRQAMGRTKYGYFPCNFVTPIYDLIVATPRPVNRDS